MGPRKTAQMIGIILLLLVSQFTVHAVTRLISQEDLAKSPHVELISFQSENDCSANEESRNIYPNQLRCRHDDNTYHEIIAEITFGQPDVMRLKEEFQELEIPLKVTSQFYKLEALKSAEHCIPLTDGECLLLNQGEAKLRISLSQLAYKHSLAAAPVVEFPYDYSIGGTDIEGGIDVVVNLSSTSGNVEGIGCFNADLIAHPDHRFITGERCAPLSCLCGATGDLESAGLAEEHNYFIEIHGTLPSCGLFPIENSLAESHFHGLFELITSNEEGTRNFTYTRDFTISDAAGTFNSADRTGTIQIILELLKDPTRYAKPPHLLDGAVVICNWDGKYLWDGPSGIGPYSHGHPNTFPIPFQGGGTEGAPVFTTAAWYYIDKYAHFSDYQLKTIRHNGMTMLDILDQIGAATRGRFGRENGHESYCCNIFGHVNEATAFLKDKVMPKVTPADILESAVAIDLDQGPDYPESFAPSYTRFRSGHPGYNPVFSHDGNPERIITNAEARAHMGITGENVIRPLLDYRLYGGDFLLHWDGMTKTRLKRGFTRGHFPLPLSLRRAARLSDVQPFGTKHRFSDEDPRPEISILATILISDRVLTARHLNLKTYIPSTFNDAKDTATNIKCNVSPFGQIIEITGFLCNAGSNTRMTPENIWAEIQCELPTGITRFLPEEAPRGFLYTADTILPEEIHPRRCAEFTYNVRPLPTAPFPLDDVSVFINKGNAQLLPAGTCDLSVYFRAPLHETTIRGSLHGNRQTVDILIGKYEAIECQNVDDDNDDPDSDGLPYFSNFDFLRGIPDQCDGPWDFGCFWNGRSQKGENLDAVLIITVYGLFALLLIVVLLVGMWNSNSTSESIIHTRGEALHKKTPLVPVRE